ncbi:MAG: hypothetical protein LQ337_001974, partial [Flavoplaca oasis]
MPPSQRSQARQTATIISVPPVHHSRQEIPDSEDDPDDALSSSASSSDPNASNQTAAPASSTAVAIRTTRQVHRDLDSLPDYLDYRALAKNDEAELEASHMAAESNASEGFDRMDLCEEGVSRDTTTTTIDPSIANASAVGTTAAENQNSSASGV